jgi:hypothetical protein
VLQQLQESNGAAAAQAKATIADLRLRCDASDAAAEQVRSQCYLKPDIQLQTPQSARDSLCHA